MLLLVCAGRTAGAAKAPQPPDPAKSLRPHAAAIRSLCSDFVDALKHDDIVAYAHCWVPVRVMRDLLADPPEGVKVPPREKHAALLDYFSQRNQAVAAAYPVLRRELLRINPDLSGMRLVSVEARPEVEHGLTRVTRFRLTIAVDAGNTVQCEIDDGVLVGGRWYFSDKPSRTLTRRGPQGISQAQFEHALRNISTAPNYVLITVIDAASGKRTPTCVEAEQLLGAISREHGVKWKEAVGLALARKDRVYRFSKPEALKAVSRPYTDQILGEARELLAGMSLAEIEEAVRRQDSPLLKFCARQPGSFGARFPAVGHVLCERGILCGRGCKPGLLYVDKTDYEKGATGQRPSTPAVPRGKAARY